MQDDETLDCQIVFNLLSTVNAFVAFSCNFRHVLCFFFPAVQHPLVDILLRDDDEQKTNINSVIVLWIQIFHLLRDKGTVKRGDEGWETQKYDIARKLCVLSSTLFHILMKIPHGKLLANGNYFHYVLQGHAEEMV